VGVIVCEMGFSCGYGYFVVMGLGVWSWVRLFVVVLWLWNGFYGCMWVEIVYINMLYAKIEPLIFSVL